MSVDLEKPLNQWLREVVMLHETGEVVHRDGLITILGPAADRARTVLHSEVECMRDDILIEAIRQRAMAVRSARQVNEVVRRLAALRSEVTAAMDVFAKEHEITLEEANSFLERLGLDLITRKFKVHVEWTVSIRGVVEVEAPDEDTASDLAGEDSDVLDEAMQNVAWDWDLESTECGEVEVA